MFTAEFGSTLLIIELRPKCVGSGVKAPVVVHSDGGAEAPPFRRGDVCDEF
jgi:hypothetical protein